MNGVAAAPIPARATRRARGIAGLAGRVPHIAHIGLPAERPDETARPPIDFIQIRLPRYKNPTESPKRRKILSPDLACNLGIGTYSVITCYDRLGDLPLNSATRLWSSYLMLQKIRHKTLNQENSLLVTPPSPLFRSVNEKVAFDNHFEGNLWFRSHAYFRRLEDGDKLEGIGSYVIPGRHAVHNVADEYPNQPRYFMSFSEDPNAARQFGNRHLRLEDPAGLLNTIRAELPCCNRFVEVAWHKIDYDKTMELERHPSAIELLRRQYYRKPEELVGEQEWRLEIKFRHSFLIQNETLKFRWRRTGDHFYAHVD